MLYPGPGGVTGALIAMPSARVLATACARTSIHSSVPLNSQLATA
jgi:hypothetical protein